MPRLDLPFGPDGPIIDVRLWIGPDHEGIMLSRGSSVPPPFSASALVDTGAQMTAIQGSLAERLELPIRGELKLGSSVLGKVQRPAPIYQVRMTFGSLEAPDAPKWRTILAVGLDVVSPGVTVLIGRDLLATCRLTYDGRKRRFMMSY